MQMEGDIGVPLRKYKVLTNVGNINRGVILGVCCAFIN